MPRMSRYARKRTRSYALKARYGRASVSAKYTAGEWLQDGENNTSSLQTNNAGSLTNVVQGVLLYGITDLGLTNTAGNKLLEAKVQGLRASGTVTVTEASAENFSVSVMTWIMACPAVVFTDWTTNSRDPNQSGLADIVNATPFRLLAGPRISRLQTGPGVNLAEFNANFFLKCRKSFVCKMPWQVYLMFGLNTVNDAATAGVPNAAMALSYNFKAKIFRPNQS